MKIRKRRPIQCGYIGKRNKRPSDLPRVHAGVLTWALNRGKGLCIAQQSLLSVVLPITVLAPVSPTRRFDKLSKWNLFLGDMSPYGWHHSSSSRVAFLGKFQFLGMHCLNSLTGSGRGVSLESFIPAETVTGQVCLSLDGAYGSQHL